MTARTRARVIAAVVILALAGSLAGAVAIRIGKRDAGKMGTGGAPVALQFTVADVAYVENRPLARWLPVSGTLQAVRQTTVKAKVAGDVAGLDLREGEAVRAGQVLAHIDSPDLKARLVDRQGAVESAKAQLALAEKTRAMNLRLLSDKFISQNAFDGTESSYNVALGNVKSAEAQAQLAQNALADAQVVAPLSGIVSKRHVQTGEKVAIESPILTIVDLNDLEVQAMVPANDVPELSRGMPVELRVDGFGERRFEGRIALAASAPAPTLPAIAVRSEAGQSYVWTIDNGKLVRRIVITGRRDEGNARVEIKTKLPRETPVLAARFDNLKDGLPALVKAAASSQNASRGKNGGAG